MKTEKKSDLITAFPRMAAVAMSRLKNRLREDYERKYPGLGEIVHLILDEEETNAWALSAFPHLFLPDLVEAHIARLGLEPANTRHEVILTPAFARPFPLAAAC